MTDIISLYQPITLEEMSSIRLMNRIDTKFVTTMSKLKELLNMARDKYMVQEIDGERNMRYNTTYFDTDDFDMFYVHQTGHANRQKLRFRTYVSSNLQFMEIKTKNNHGRTSKKRIEVKDMNIEDIQKKEFLSKHLHYAAGSLKPAVRNMFDRITLVNNAKTERLTIDTNLSFCNLSTGIEKDMENLVVVELKRDGVCYSPVLEMLRQLRILPHGFSKYCIGSAFTNSSLQVNGFKPKVTGIQKMINAAR